MMALGQLLGVWGMRWGRTRIQWRELFRSLPWKSWRRWQGKGRSGYFCVDCCNFKLDIDKLQKMDAWILLYLKTSE